MVTRKPLIPTPVSRPAQHETLNETALRFIRGAPDGAGVGGKPRGRRSRRDFFEGPTKQITVKVEEGMYEAFYNAAAKRNDAMTVVLRRAIVAYLKKHAPDWNANSEEGAGDE